MIHKLNEEGEAKVGGSVKYYKYNFYKVVREWRFLPKEERDSQKAEFISVFGDTVKRLNLENSSFSLFGLRSDVDLMILLRANHLEPFQEFQSALLSTGLGKYLEMPYSYLALTRISPYLGTHKHADQEGISKELFQSNSKFLFVYPFVKKRSWYKLRFEDRQKMMMEHVRIGHKYPRIRINTGYSYGIDDQEFVLAFEGDDPYEFLTLVEELRSSDASVYTKLETPIFVCRRMGLDSILDMLG